MRTRFLLVLISVNLQKGTGLFLDCGDTRMTDMLDGKMGN